MQATCWATSATSNHVLRAAPSATPTTLCLIPYTSKWFQKCRRTPTKERAIARIKLLYELSAPSSPGMAPVAPGWRVPLHWHESADRGVAAGAVQLPNRVIYKSWLVCLRQDCVSHGPEMRLHFDQNGLRCPAEARHIWQPIQRPRSARPRRAPRRKVCQMGTAIIHTRGAAAQLLCSQGSGGAIRKLLPRQDTRSAHGECNGPPFRHCPRRL